MNETNNNNKMYFIFRDLAQATDFNLPQKSGNFANKTAPNSNRISGT